jgi:branched-chain amino acid aminotransferase
MTTMWMDGRIRSAEQARVPVLDRGLTSGDGVFETLLVVDGQAFALTRHLRRLSRSLSVLGLPPLADGRVREAIAETLAAAGPLPRGRLRVTVTAGVAPLGAPRREQEPTLIVAVAPTDPWPERIAAVTVPWVRNERSAVAGAKTTSSAENAVCLRAAEQAGAQEALLGNTRGEVCEGSGSNVFVLVDGALATPPLSSGCLSGVTRELVLEWSVAAGLPVVERTMPMSVLAGAAEVVLTSSTRLVQPVHVLDGRELQRGELVGEVRDLFARRAAQEIDP